MSSSCVHGQVLRCVPLVGASTCTNLPHSCCSSKERSHVKVVIHMVMIPSQLSDHFRAGMPHLIYPPKPLLCGHASTYCMAILSDSISRSLANSQIQVYRRYTRTSSGRRCGFLCSGCRPQMRPQCCNELCGRIRSVHELLRTSD